MVIMAAIRSAQLRQQAPGLLLTIGSPCSPALVAAYKAPGSFGQSWASRLPGGRGADGGRVVRRKKHKVAQQAVWLALSSISIRPRGTASP